MVARNLYGADLLPLHRSQLVNGNYSYNAQNRMEYIWRIHSVAFDWRLFNQYFVELSAELWF